MHFSELTDYSQSIDSSIQKYPQIIILKGMECEYISGYKNFYKEELIGRYNFDYLIRIIKKP